MKGKTLGYIKGIQNVGYCVAETDMKIGMGVILDQVAGTAHLPATADEAKACHRWVSNINDKPERHNFKDTLTVYAGEKVRADDLTHVANLEMEIADYEISTDYASIAEKDTLVYGTDGLLVKGAPDGYKVYFEVIKKTAYMGKGILAIVRVQ